MKGKVSKILSSRFIRVEVLLHASISDQFASNNFHHSLFVRKKKFFHNLVLIQIYEINNR